MSPSSETSHDSASPGVVAKSSAALSVSVAYCSVQNSYSVTRNPEVTLSVSSGWVMPMVRTTSSSS